MSELRSISIRLAKRGDKFRIRLRASGQLTQVVDFDSEEEAEARMRAVIKIAKRIPEVNGITVRYTREIKT